MPSARYTDLPVRVAADNQRVEPNHVYVLPANAILGIEHGCLRITKPNASRRARKPIDDQGEHAAGVVLSGGDGDGTLGVKAIKERGGLTLVRGLQVLAGIAAATDSAARGAVSEEVRREICTILRNQVGHDFLGYKPKTFFCRVHRRAQVARLDTVEGYLELLRRDPQEAVALFRDLLIGVTNFFRDADAFEALATTVVPKLFEGRSADEAVRVWVPGCATGEEVFSIAILLREHMDRLGTAVPRVQVFATDIDEHALGVARAARYPEPLLDSVTPERRQRFFVRDGGSYVIAKEVRDLCVFSPHNVLRDPPFSRIDLVSCRNLLIYFGLGAQNQVIPVFHYALRPEGYLFLGTAENVSGFGDLFTPIEKQHRIFRRRTDGGQTIRLPMTLGKARPGHVAEPTPRRAGTSGSVLRQAVEGQVLERFAPGFVAVNRDGDIVQYSARTGRYLEAMAGAPTRQILTLARKGLRLGLRATLREAVETGRMVSRGGIAIEEEDGRVQMVTLTVEPLRDRDGRESGVTMPPDVSRRGYGRELIERALAYTTRAKTQLAFGADGVACRIEMPLPIRPQAGIRPERQNGTA